LNEKRIGRGSGDEGNVKGRDNEGKFDLTSMGTPSVFYMDGYLM